MSETWSFDAEIAAGTDPTAGGAVPVELPPDLQRHGTLWPTPAEQVSDHNAEGAPWLPAARGIPQDPPQGPLWAADHDGPSVPYGINDWQAGPQTGAHDGSGAAAAAPNGRPYIGQPFSIDQGSTEQRHLATDQWDSTGRRVSPPDAPSAPHQLYGSEHFTTPRLVPFQVGALFTNVAHSNQFSSNPGYLGVNAGVPSLAARPSGAVAAQMPSDPFVAAAQGQRPPPAAIDYETGW